MGASVYHLSLKDFREVGKQRLPGEGLWEASADEVDDLRFEEASPRSGRGNQGGESEEPDTAGLDGPRA
jgi:hypothetical protein